MEKSILLLQTEIMILSHLKNSMQECLEAMSGRLEYSTFHIINRGILQLENEITSMTIKIGSLKEI